MSPELDERPATFGDIRELEERVDMKIKEIMSAIKDRRSVFQWVIGVAVSLLILFSTVMVERLSTLYDKVSEHHENAELHMTAAERRTKEKAEVDYRENVLYELRELRSAFAQHLGGRDPIRGGNKEKYP